MSGTRQPGRNRELITLTATTLTVTPHDAGKTIVCNASGATTITMADPGTFTPGCDVLIVNLADQDLTVSCNEKIVTKNNAAADSVALSTSNEKIGGGFWMHCLGTLWLALPLAEEAQTVTVGTD